MADDADLHEVIRREKLLLDPAVRASSEDVVALLHPDFVEVGESGRVWDRAGLVEALHADPVLSGEGADFQVVSLDECVALVTYRIDGERPSMRSSVWVKDIPVLGWRMRFHQGTHLPG